MELTVGSIVDGKVTGITKFGAFVDIGVHRDGLVHISQICDRFIRHPSEVLSVGDVVKVVVLEADAQKGRINLSIKKTADPPARPVRRSAPPPPADNPSAPRAASFEDKLKQFMQDSDSRLSGVRQYSERSSRRRGGRGGGYSDYDD